MCAEVTMCPNVSGSYGVGICGCLFPREWPWKAWLAGASTKTATRVFHFKHTINLTEAESGGAIGLLKLVVMIKFRLILALFFFAHITIGFAQVEIDGVYYHVESSTHTAWSTRLTTDKILGDFVIPSKIEYNGEIYIVTEVGYAFQRCTSLTSITIPNSITYMYNEELRTVI